MKIFTIFDSKAEAFLPPFTSRTNATAIRNFTAAANTEDHDFHTHAADYTLFQIGTFDEIRGLVIPRENGSENLGTALQFLQQDSFPKGNSEAYPEPNGDMSPAKLAAARRFFRTESPSNLELDE